MQIEDLIYKTEKIDWHLLNYSQPESLKKTNKERLQKLKTSLINNGFAMSFFTFEKDGKIYIIDGHHRLKALYEIEREGVVDIPGKFTCSFIQVRDDKHLKKLILAYSSSYSDFTDDGLSEFIEDMDIEELNMEFELDINIENGGEETPQKEKKKRECPECGHIF